jgi:archaellum component FlaC
MDILNQVTDLVTPTTTSGGPSDEFDTLIDSIDERIGKSVTYYMDIKTQLDKIKIPLNNMKTWIGNQKGNLTVYDNKIKSLEKDINKLTDELKGATLSESTSKLEIEGITKQLEECNKAKKEIEDDKNVLSEKVQKVTEAMRNWDKQLEGNEDMEFKGDELKGMVETIIAMSSNVDEMISMSKSLPLPPISPIPSSSENDNSPPPPPSENDSSSSSSSENDSSFTINPMQQGQGKKRKHIKTRRKTHSRTRSKSLKSKKSKKSNKTKKLKKLKHKHSHKRSRK